MSRLRTKTLFLIIVICYTYAGTLSHGFIKDDHLIIMGNSFYHSLENLPRLWNRSYFSYGSDSFIEKKKDLGSGSVAYRPVLSLTYFFDAWLWGKNPFGFHLTNLLLHILNSVFLYRLLIKIFREDSIPFFSALLFGLHPIQSEAVCNIGFRADLVASLFILLGLLAYVTARKDPKRRPLFIILSLVAYFFSVFTKESAVIFPLLVLLHDFCFIKKGKKKLFFGEFTFYYTGLVAISIFYLFIYFFIFPNHTIQNVSPLGGDILHHCVIVFRIFADYILAVVAPVIVYPLVDSYVPEITAIWGWKTMFSALTLAGVLTSAIITFRCRKQISYGLWWFFICLIPVANIIPLTNPMAYRFMYLPSIGLFVAFSILLEENILQKKVFISKKSRLALRTLVVGVCMVWTLVTVGLWKNDFTLSSFLIRRYPAYPRDYVRLGGIFEGEGRYALARSYYKQAIKRTSKNSFFYWRLALCYPENPKKALKYLRMAVQRNPNNQRAHYDACRIFGKMKRFGKSLACFEEVRQIAPMSKNVFLSYIQICTEAGNYSKARKVLGQALVEYPDDIDFLRWRRLIDDAGESR